MSTQHPAAATVATHETLQNLIDAAARRGGGRVEIPPGDYLMHDALHLRSGVHVVGRGDVTLRKAPSVSSALRHFLGYGHYEFAVAEPDLFRPGMGVLIHDDNSMGFYDTVGNIKARQGEWFFISRMANHDYLPSRHATVTSLHSLIEADGVEHAGVEGLVLDGNTQETRTLNGCRGGAVFLIMSRDITLKSLHITHFKGEGISFQQCADVTIQHCHIENVTGNGLHPGSGSVRYLLEHNHCHHNGHCGVFYCLRTTHSICRANRLHDNGMAGISVGERDTDHRIADNVIECNRGAGVEFRDAMTIGGDRTLLAGNALRHNQLGRQGAAEIMIGAGLRDVHVLDNTIAPAEGCCAMQLGENGQRICVAGNTVAGLSMRTSDLRGSAQSVTWTAPSPLQVGPAALPLDGARHLNWPALPTWSGPA